MTISPALRPIHPTAVRRAFGEDRDHPAVPGTIKGTRGITLLAALAGGDSFEVIIDDPAFAQASQRDDLCRHKGDVLALLNPHYGLIGLAIGPVAPPPRLAVSYGVCRLAHGTAIEIPGEGPQPGWLLFRCRATPVRP